MNIIGFTGTRNGMTLSQIKKVIKILRDNNPITIHHGACVGADEQFLIITQKRFKPCLSAAHPSNIKSMTTKIQSDFTYPPRNPIRRNKDIVNMSDVLVATPKTQGEELRSGTWATIRYARKQNKPRYIIFPNGDVSRDERS